jgi:hypothetical protein
MINKEEENLSVEDQNQTEENTPKE